MAVTKSVKTLRAVIESEGLDILSVQKANHFKFEVYYKGKTFTLVTSVNDLDSDQRKITSFRSDVRRAKKAVDTGDEALMKKYMGAHE